MNIFLCPPLPSLLQKRNEVETFLLVALEQVKLEIGRSSLSISISIIHYLIMPLPFTEAQRGRNLSAGGAGTSKIRAWAAQLGSVPGGGVHSVYMYIY